jgi:putative Ca2+/H+ antiporter (TMEM165/GDT1 family)
MREAALYALTSIAYVLVGVLVPEALFSWVEGAAFLVVGVVLLPALVRRLR